MGGSLSAVQKRFIGTEIAIGTLLGSLLPGTAMYLTMGPFPMPLWGESGFALFLLKNAMGMGTVMTLLMTLVVRMRVRKGSAPALEWTRDGSSVLKSIPQSILLRAPLFGLLAVAFLGAPAIAVAVAADIQSIERMPFVLFLAANSACIALCLIPFILIGAMSDMPRRSYKDASS